MRQGFSFGHVHAEKYLISLFAGKPKLVEMARCAVPAPAERKGGTNFVGLAVWGSLEGGSDGQRGALPLPKKKTPLANRRDYENSTQLSCGGGTGFGWQTQTGRDGALRRPRPSGTERRNERRWFWRLGEARQGKRRTADSAARCPYQRKKPRWRTGGIMKTQLNFLAAAEPEHRRATKGGQGRRAW
jgi:hypothetical protein